MEYIKRVYGNDKWCQISDEVCFGYLMSVCRGLFVGECVEIVDSLDNDAELCSYCNEDKDTD